MSTGSTLTVSDEKVLLSGYLHTQLLSTLLLGMYTPLYFGTMYIYIVRKPTKSWIVLTATTVLYVAIATTGIVACLKIPLLIGISGEAGSQNLSAELNTLFGTSGMLVQILAVLPFVVADGLLIWRSFKICNNSLRVIALPLILLSAETALYTAVIVYTKLTTTEAGAGTINRLTSAALFTTLAVTLWATVLIGYRIYSASNRILNRKRPRFYNILEMTTQSSFIYSLSLVPSALLGQIIPGKQQNNFALITASNYTNAILSAMAGIAPTMMVARIALASNSDSDTEPTATGMISDIQINEVSQD